MHVIERLEDDIIEKEAIELVSILVLPRFEQYIFASERCQELIQEIIVG